MKTFTKLVGINVFKTEQINQKLEAIQGDFI